MPLDPVTERVAQAVYEASRDELTIREGITGWGTTSPTWIALPIRDQESFRQIAQAAIKAMPDATQENGQQAAE